MQEYNGISHPLSYVSKSLSKAQRNYSATKKEALALIFALEQFRHIILLFEIHVYTDHKPLMGALYKPTKDACLQRWALLVQEYKIKLHWITGSTNLFADLLSRLPNTSKSTKNLPERFDEELNSRMQYCNIAQEYIPERWPFTPKQLHDAQRKDVNCINIIAQLNNRELDNNKIPEDILLNARISKNILYMVRNIKRGTFIDKYLVPYIPDSLMPAVFKVMHIDVTAGHKDADRTIKMFVHNFYNFAERIIN